jgi:hypothetical protein
MGGSLKMKRINEGLEMGYVLEGSVQKVELQRQDLFSLYSAIRPIDPKRLEVRLNPK